ncbi:MAG: response regulator transcription factor [Caldicoprobacterales bacterium]|jgi:DNA-binding response OmpR family regulator
MKKGGVRVDMPCILVVDDDREIVRAISINLQKEGYRVIEAYDGMQALEAISSQDIHLILLDIMMPKLDGLSATMKIRQDKNIPIIILSAKSEDTDKILGLSMGADDYVTKPFNSMELMARVKSQLRRYMTLGDVNMKEKNNKVIKTGRLTFDTETRTLTADGSPVRLTATETKIVELLIKNMGRTFPAEEIYERVWGEAAYSVENTVMVHIRRIREKIEINPREPEYLKVVWGIGYKIEKI